MKKIYISPNMKVIKSRKTHLLAGSGEGVTNYDKLGEEYTDTDVSY